MSDHEQEKFEAQLRQLKPGKLPEDLVARIQDAVSSRPQTVITARQRATPGFLQILRWLVPATAAVIVTTVLWQRQENSGEPGVSNVDLQGSVAATPLKPDNVQIGKELVSSFDAVATLPGGEPVRFRCQQWLTTVVVDDAKRGLLMESRTPRVVVVPVGFETY
ncbi:MAG TPA: hypothetical protein VFZ59_08690 [Verrucomicrobiae bacterium]|nr:hypothetical protein [Verrucomicrobiae bacterium]